MTSEKGSAGEFMKRSVIVRDWRSEALNRGPWRIFKDSEKNALNDTVIIDTNHSFTQIIL